VPQYFCHATVRHPTRSSRTWSVTPSGSRPEPFAVEQGSESSALSAPRVRLPPPRRACRAPSQGRARRRRETRGHGCHGQSPLGVGPCFTRALSRAATPLLDPHYRASQLVWVAPTSTHHRPRPRFYTCSRVPASRGPMRGSPWLPRILNVRLDTASDPGEYPCRSPWRDTDCCLPAGQNRRHSPTKIFGAQHLQGRLHPLPLHLACLSAEASTRLLPVTPQGSILGSRLTITQAGLAPARTRGLARPHCPRFPQVPSRGSAWRAWRPR
jgi:hypothetical protein